MTYFTESEVEAAALEWLEALDDAFRKLTRPEGSTVEARNRAFHRLLVEGVTVEYETLRDIARELVETVRNNVRIDWTIRENVRTCGGWSSGSCGNTDTRPTSRRRRPGRCWSRRKCCRSGGRGELLRSPATCVRRPPHTEAEPVPGGSPRSSNPIDVTRISAFQSRTPSPMRQTSGGRRRGSGPPGAVRRRTRRCGREPPGARRLCIIYHVICPSRLL